MQASDLILHILKHGPLPTTKLMKLVYLVDLAWVQLTGKPLTSLPYIWHLRGPYCDALATALLDLVDKHAVTVKYGTTRDGHHYALYTMAEPPQEGDADVENVVTYIVRRFSRMDLASLLDYVYATPPMTKAQQGRRGRRLDLVTTIEQHSDDARAVLEQQLADTGKRVPGDDVLRKLRCNVTTAWCRAGSLVRVPGGAAAHMSLGPSNPGPPEAT